MLLNLPLKRIAFLLASNLKEKDKAWLLYYMRWDICTEAERRNGANNVSFKHTATKGAWQLDSEKLSEIKNFLALF
ncbi:hypothetical protein DTQ70_18335 [Runella sp. SP2]|nr:hypothetical protein DTQ70_18335 [Runella sp. SP2]